MNASKGTRALLNFGYKLFAFCINLFLSTSSIQYCLHYPLHIENTKDEYDKLSDICLV